MEDIEILIKNLNDKIDEYQKDIEFIQNEVKELKKQSFINQETISSKEKELTEIKTNLFKVSTERDDIREEIGKKIKELNNSNLSKEEKADRITKLMTGEYLKLKSACQNITRVWKDYGVARDNLIEVQKQLSTSRLKAIQSIEKTKKNLWIIIWVLLAVVILLSLSLSLSLSLFYYKQKKTKKIKI